jgi:hypothetical protein
MKFLVLVPEDDKCSNNDICQCSNLYVIILQDCVSPHRAHETGYNSTAVSGEADGFAACTAAGIISSETCAENPQIPSLASGTNFILITVVTY